MHFAGSNLSRDPKCPKCIYKISKNFKAEKSLETSAFLVFSCLHLNQTLIMAAEEGFEPSQTESESVVLPLHNSAINSTLTIIAHAVRFVNSFFAIFDFYLKILRRNAEKGCLKAHSESLTAPESRRNCSLLPPGKAGARLSAHCVSLRITPLRNAAIFFGDWRSTRFNHSRITAYPP